MNAPLITIAVPSFNQGRYLNDALASIFQQDLPVEVYLVDGGSTDESVEVIRRWEHKLAGWRSEPDDGQAAAINEGIAAGKAPYVYWLNSDDYLQPNRMSQLTDALAQNPAAPAAYGRAWDYFERSRTMQPVWVEPFDEHRLALRCIISQPATLIRRAAWEAVGGVDQNLHMAMDYDLWWRLYKAFGPLHFEDAYIAVNRVHRDTKTRAARRLHYREAISVVRKHYGRVPAKWWLAQPYAVWFKAFTRALERK